MAAVVVVVVASDARADDWLPHHPEATWTYEWTDSVYNTIPTRERVTVKEDKGASFVLAWTTVEQGNAEGAPVSVGTIAFQETSAGLVNTDWSSTLPPPGFPILCPTPVGCNNSLVGTLYNVIWGTRAPVLAAPLLQGTEWASTGGATGDVTSGSDYLGVESVTVPAFPMPVVASKVRSEITQAGALGDPYGSGVRTVWWVYGVGPVKVEFQHAGATAPVTTSVLVETSLTPKPPPPDTRWFPLAEGQKLRYRWWNTKHMRERSVQEVTIDQVVNGAARFSVKHVTGPVRLAGSYGFTTRADGVTNLWASTRSATLAALPPLGPASLPKAKRRRFTTPLDLALYGFNPLLPAYPTAGQSWSAIVPSRDYSVFGVTGTATVVGTARVKVPAGTFSALVVRTKLTQKGFPFGSGVRTTWFAPGKGLVKLVFRHGDGSVSTVELLR